MPSKNAAQFIIETLVDRNVDIVFGMPGSHVNDLYPLLAAASIRHITVKHENNGAIKADVYGRLTGKPGVLITTAGPGGTNALSGIATAYNAASPLIHLCGSPERGAKKEGFHGGSSEDFLQKIFEPVAKWSYRLKSSEEVPRVLSIIREIGLSSGTSRSFQGLDPCTTIRRLLSNRPFWLADFHPISYIRLTWIEHSRVSIESRPIFSPGLRSSLSPPN